MAKTGGDGGSRKLYKNSKKQQVFILSIDLWNCLWIAPCGDAEFVYDELSIFKSSPAIPVLKYRIQTPDEQPL